jgi:hypothetical protein
LELLYNVPPLYHLNRGEFEKHKERIRAHYRFFSPLHREAATLPMTGFTWLTPDRRVQRTVFGGRIDLIANFGLQPIQYGDATLPPRSLVARWRRSGRTATYIPGAQE